MPVSLAIELTDVSKRFGAVKANDKVSLSVEEGTIHGIVGENGAGKSTLMSILYGFYQYDSGNVKIFGKDSNFQNSREALAAGIGMVHQHFMLVKPFTVLENVMLGNEGGKLLKNGADQAREELTRLANEYGLSVDIDARVSSLSVGIQQRVEILKALYRGAKILILDEPTGVLTPQETTELFRILNALKSQGVTIVLITHKLQEIMAVTDAVSIMRAGQMVAHRKTSETDKTEIAELMVGRKVLLQVDKGESARGEPLIKVRDLSVKDSAGVIRVKGLNFEVHAGEVVGIAGISGNGQSQLLNALSGISRIESGSIEVNGTTLTRNKPVSPERMREIGLAHVPQDRHKEGMVDTFSAYETSILGYHNSPDFNGRFMMSRNKVKSYCAKLMDAFDVRPRDPNLKSANFSGGNQQKLILAREFEHNPDVLIIGQPTRGVDIGAIEFIHRRIIEMRDAGKAILLVSVELEEIISVSDRVLVMCDGLITGEVAAADADEITLGLMMTKTDSDIPKSELSELSRSEPSESKVSA